MILSIVRHGQTYYNASGLVQGQIDIPLNDTGKAQATELGQTLRKRNEHYDVIMASPLSRARESAELIAKELGYKDEILLDSRFVERDFHHLDGTPVETAMPLVRSKNYAFESYETDFHLIDRIQHAALDLAKHHPNHKVLLVAHSHVIKALMIYADPKAYTFADLIKHADVITFEIVEDSVRVIGKK
jgi:broad specificity phosphatase PhoE